MLTAVGEHRALSTAVPQHSTVYTAVCLRRPPKSGWTCTTSKWSLPFHCLSLPFHCLSLTLHCLAVLARPRRSGRSPRPTSPSSTSRAPVSGGVPLLSPLPSPPLSSLHSLLFSLPIVNIEGTGQWRILTALLSRPECTRGSLSDISDIFQSSKQSLHRAQSDGILSRTNDSCGCDRLTGPGLRPDCTGVERHFRCLTD